MLNKRLCACADFVTGEKICDVGTDHAFLVAHLLTTGKCSSAVAADINEGPLAAARANLEKYGVLNKCTLILSDGLENIRQDGITDIVIAGMGGELIARILENCKWLKSASPAVNLILQPMSQMNFLRRRLYENGYEIKAETGVEDAPHFYDIINASYCGVKTSPDELFTFTGKLDPGRTGDAAFLRYQAGKLFAIGRSRAASGNAADGIGFISSANKIYLKTGDTNMLKVKDILSEMDKIAPLANLHKGDNSGLLVGDPEATVTKVITALDITCDVVNEAVECGANVIVSHHPVIFNPLYTLSETNPACLALKNNIACICFHSPLDIAQGGINDIIYDMLKKPFGLSKKSAVLEPVHSDGRGYGMVCEAANTFTPSKAAKLLKDIFGCTVVRYTNGYREIKRLAFCSGGAGSDLPLAIALGADAFVTGDVKHDQLITAKNNGISVFDCGHYHTEVIAMAYLKKCFGEDFPELSFEIAKSCTDPAEYAL